MGQVAGVILMIIMDRQCPTKKPNVQKNPDKLNNQLEFRSKSPAK